MLFILLPALLIRLLSAIFSRGFGMHDDHFLVIEPSYWWSQGINYQEWLPLNGSHPQPDGHSLFYSGLHYLFFIVCDWLGISDPQVKMLIVRIIHALFSLLAVYFTYRITDKIAGKKEAFTASLLMAFLWFMPFLSVRNLVEIVSIPFLLAGMWFIISANDSAKPMWNYLLSGIIMGLAFSVRFQTASFIAGTGLALLLLRLWWPAVVFGAGVLLSILPIQGLVDYFIWGAPFTEFAEYVRYNMQAAYDYIIGPWYNYILLLAGILIPPVSLFLLAGFFATWRKHLLIFLPTFIFLVFHSVFPNKQERFIFPVIPFVVLLGTVGWSYISGKSALITRNRKLINGSWKFFWVLNILLLLLVSFSYSKKSRVEAMSYLSDYKDVKMILLEDSKHNSAKMVPVYYMGQWVDVMSKSKSGYQLNFIKTFQNTDSLRLARFVLFFENDSLDGRVEALKPFLPSLEYETTIHSGMVDRFMHWINPVNLNQDIYIYRNTALIPETKK
ncbi:MAG TPA: glycosyltransferase family 39 protein [Bacteroidales bacterium]|nr:glycosyltransferase family 39 protein [Bacteroidales bacterium]